MHDLDCLRLVVEEAPGLYRKWPHGWLQPMRKDYLTLLSRGSH
jgi:hypothetical protein